MINYNKGAFQKAAEYLTEEWIFQVLYNNFRFKNGILSYKNEIIQENRDHMKIICKYE